MFKNLLLLLIISGTQASFSQKTNYTKINSGETIIISKNYKISGYKDLENNCVFIINGEEFLLVRQYNSKIFKDYKRGIGIKLTCL